jgi:hypothetical protein
MRIVGFTGKAKVGKTTLANRIINYSKDKNVVILPFSQPLKTEVAEMLARTCSESETASCVWTRSRYFKETYSSILEELNDSDKKERYRVLLQWWGTDFRRNLFGFDYWVNKWIKTVLNLKDVDIVIADDVRFDNEAEAIYNLNGTNHLVFWEKSNNLLVPSHVSEKGINKDLLDSRYPQINSDVNQDELNEFINWLNST